MENYTSSRSLVITSSNDILKIAAEAKDDRAQGNRVIDGSIGVFLNDDKSLNGVSSVITALTNHITDNLSYPKIIGSEEYKTAILKWFLKDNYEYVIKNYFTPFSATLGGTGAISIAFNTYLEEGETVLLPSIMWSNYKLIAKKAGLKSDTYEMFNNDFCFNIDNLITKIEALQKVQKNVLVIINDPCQNPTGYCLSEKEYSILCSKLDELSVNGNITVLFDIAYLNYDCKGNEAHHLFKNILGKERKFLPLFAASCSKTFGIYGLRLGALFSINKCKETSIQLINSIESIARGTYSCPDGPAIDCIAEVLNNPETIEKTTEEITKNTLVLQERGKYIRHLFDANKINYLPYQNGFFLTALIDNAYEVCEALKKKHVYLVPLDNNSIRIAISGLNIPDIEELVYHLSTILKGSLKGSLK